MKKFTLRTLHVNLLTLLLCLGISVQTQSMQKPVAEAQTEIVPATPQPPVALAENTTQATPQPSTMTSLMRKIPTFLERTKTLLFVCNVSLLALLALLPLFGDDPANILSALHVINDYDVCSNTKIGEMTVKHCCKLRNNKEIACAYFDPKTGNSAQGKFTLSSFDGVYKSPDDLRHFISFTVARETCKKIRDVIFDRESDRFHDVTYEAQISLFKELYNTRTLRSLLSLVSPRPSLSIGLDNNEIINKCGRASSAGCFDPSKKHLYIKDSNEKTWVLFVIAHEFRHFIQNSNSMSVFRTILKIVLQDMPFLKKFLSQQSVLNNNIEIDADLGGLMHLSVATDAPGFAIKLAQETYGLQCRNGEFDTLLFNEDERDLDDISKHASWDVKRHYTTEFGLKYIELDNILKKQIITTKNTVKSKTFSNHYGLAIIFDLTTIILTILGAKALQILEKKVVPKIYKNMSPEKAALWQQRIKKALQASNTAIDVLQASKNAYLICALATTKTLNSENPYPTIALLILPYIMPIVKPCVPIIKKVGSYIGSKLCNGAKKAWGYISGLLEQTEELQEENKEEHQDPYMGLIMF